MMMTANAKGATSSPEECDSNTTSNNNNKNLPAKVACALQDKVAMDLRQEVATLQQKLQHLRTVTITGPKGFPVYAKANFRDGHASNRNLWKLRFSRDDDGRNTTANDNNNNTRLPCCFLKDFPDMQIRVGGACKGSFAGAYSGALDPVMDDTGNLIDPLQDGGDSLISFYMTQSAGLVLTVEAGPFPNSEALLDLAFDEPDELAQQLKSLENTDNVTVNFRGIDFIISQVPGLVEEDADYFSFLTPPRIVSEVDLAPFVLAYQDNKEVSNLLKQARIYRHALKRFRAVKITGAGGAPVYAEAQFEDGKYYCNQQLWEVDFLPGQPTFHRDSFAMCRLRDLMSVEVFFGGFCQGRFSDYRVHGSVTGVPGDGESFINNSGLFSFFMAGSMQLWLFVRVSPFRDEDEFWHSYQYICRTQGYESHMLAEQLTNLDRADTMVVRFERAFFVTDYYNGAIDSL